MGNSTGNFKNNVDSVDIELGFDIDPIKGQDEIRKFGYYFNAKGQCRNIETEERVGRFPSQKEYEEFGAALERYIFFLLTDQYNMTEKLIKSTHNDDDDDDDDASETQQQTESTDTKKDIEMKDSKKSSKKQTKSKRKTRSQINPDKIAKSRIYLSPNYGEKQTLLLLIPGSGAVRAGQWARSICINDNLAAGCMYPFISEAYKRDWGVVLFDPNGRTERGNVFSDEHVMYVYDRYIERAYLSKKECKIENVLIVCHSAGGMATTRLLNDKKQYLLPRIRAVAGTDTFFGKSSGKAVQKVYKMKIVNWVSSSQPLGTILSDNVPKRVSAGHTAHEYTSASAFPHIFNYFDAMLKMHDMKAIQDKSLTKQEQKQDDAQCVKADKTKDNEDINEGNDKDKNKENKDKDKDTESAKKDDPKNDNMEIDNID